MQDKENNVNSSKKDRAGCIVGIVLFLVLIAWIRISDRIDEKRNNRERELYSELLMRADSAFNHCDFEQEIALLEEAYQHANFDFKTINKMKVKWRIIGRYEFLKEFEKANKLLNAFTKEFGQSVFTDLLHARLLIEEGKSQEAYTVLESVISSFKGYKDVGVFGKLWTLFTDSDNNERIIKNYYEYFYGYICCINALEFEDFIINDSILKIENRKRLFDIAPELDIVTKSYLDFKDKRPSSHAYDDEAEYQIMQSARFPYTFSDSIDNLIEELYRAKWNYTTKFLILHDAVYGYEDTKTKMSNIIQRNHTTVEKFPKFLVDVYMSLGEENNKSHITYEDFRSFYKMGWMYLVKLKPVTIDGQISSFIKAGITDSRILIKCNDWAFSDSLLFTSDNVVRDIGKTKEIVLLSDEYKLDTIKITTDKLGVLIQYVPVPIALYQMLLLDFSFNDTIE